MNNEMNVFGDCKATDNYQKSLKNFIEIFLLNRILLFLSNSISFRTQKYHKFEWKNIFLNLKLEMMPV